MNKPDSYCKMNGLALSRVRSWRFGVVGVGLFVVLLSGALSFAQNERPTWQSVVFLGLHPKSGQDYSDIDLQQGPLKDYFETFYEGWWRELGYWESDPETGIGIRGRYMDTRVDYDYEPLPWPYSPVGASPADWGNAAPLEDAGSRTPDYRGEYNFELNEEGEPMEMYESGEPNPLLDGYWTPGERFYDTMNPPSDTDDDGITDLESSAPDGVFTREIPTEARWMPDVSGSPPPLLGLTHIENEDDWNHVTGGEYFFDWDAGTDLPTGVIDCDGSNTMTVWVGYEIGSSRGNIAMELTDFDYVRQGNDGGVYPYFDIGDFEHNLMIDTNDTLVVPDGAPGLIPTNRVLDLHYYQNTQPLLTEVGEFTIWRWVRDSDGEFDGIVVSNATDFTKEEYLTIKVYQAGMLYGDPDGLADSGSSSLELIADADYVLTPSSRTVAHGTVGERTELSMLVTMIPMTMVNSMPVANLRGLTQLPGVVNMF